MTEVADETQDTPETDAPDGDPSHEHGPQHDDHDDGGEQDGGEPAASMSEKAIEKALAKLDAETTRHANRVSEIMGEDAQALVVCELCEPNIPGFRWAAVPEDDPRAALIALLSEGLPAQPPEDDEAERCERCDGYGVTVTHSRVPGQETRACSKCGAKGYTTADERRDWESRTESARVANEIASGFSMGAQPPQTTLAKDEWGRPQGTEFFGKDPKYMTTDELGRDWMRTTAV